MAGQVANLEKTFRTTAGDCTLNGIHRAGEISDETVARRVEDPASMRGDQAIDDDPVSREGTEGADLIPAHEAALALHIGGENRGELSFDGWGFQGSASSLPGL
jgi:hypothetical protein